jgi:hypothetical protein
MRRPAPATAIVLFSAFLLLPLAAQAQQSVPGGPECEHPQTCAAGTVWNPGSKTCEPVSS